MKNFAFILITAGSLSLSACNSATNKRGGNSADSGATGSSGPADTSMQAPATGSAAGNSNATTDTSTTDKSTTNPTVDSGKTKKP